MCMVYIDFCLSLQNSNLSDGVLDSLTSFIEKNRTLSIFG